MQRKEININLEGLVLGRAASIIAQRLLEGFNVNAYNAELVVITGNEKSILAKYVEKMNFHGKGNPIKGPKYPRYPHMIFRRTIRNMLPHKKARGQEAMSRLKVHLTLPTNVKTITLEDAKLKQGLKFVELRKISEKLGARW